MNAGPGTPLADPAVTASRRRILARTRLGFWLDGLLLVACTFACSLVDLLSGHGPIVLTGEPGGQGARPGRQGVAADRAAAGRRLHLPDELTRQTDQVGDRCGGQVIAECHASQQGQPEENDVDRVPGPGPRRRPPQASNVTCLPRGVVAS